MYRRHIFKLSVLLATFAVVPFAGQGAYAADCGATAEEVRAAVLEELNRVRSSGTQCGTNVLPMAEPLVWNDTLADVARSHSDDMATNNFLAYAGSDGLGFGDKVSQAGYDYRSVGASIVGGATDVAGSVESSLEQPGPCEVLVSDSADVGAACIEAPENSDYDTYWTILLGNQYDTPTADEGTGEPATDDGQVSLVSESNNLCIDVPQSNFTDGTRLNMYQCNDTDAQQWSFNEGRVETGNGQCMDPAGGAGTDGTPIQVASCSSNPAQQFTLTAEGDLFNEASGKCVDILNFDTEPGAPLILFNCQGTSNQKWVTNG